MHRDDTGQDTTGTDVTVEQRWYTISVTVERTGVSVQRLRLLEREGLVQPRRSGREREYSAADLARIRKIRRLTEHLGVNLAGAEIILRLTEELEALRRRECRAAGGSASPFGRDRRPVRPAPPG
jgi:MerR family transcriptional regulator, heat shock protein HspR